MTLPSSILCCKATSLWLRRLIAVQGAEEKRVPSEVEGYAISPVSFKQLHGANSSSVAIHISRVNDRSSFILLPERRLQAGNNFSEFKKLYFCALTHYLVYLLSKHPPPISLSFSLSISFSLSSALSLSHTHTHTHVSARTLTL